MRPRTPPIRVSSPYWQRVLEHLAPEDHSGHKPLVHASDRDASVSVHAVHGGAFETNRRRH